MFSLAKDWLATATSGAGVLTSLASFDVAQRLALALKPSLHQPVVTEMAKAINRGLRLGGTQFAFRGHEHLAPAQPYIIVGNHQSIFDISLASEVFVEQQPRYVAKRELSRGSPGVSINLRAGGSALIDRKDPEQSRAAIAELARHVRDDGWSVVIFPEGTRSRDGKMKPFKTGGLRTLTEIAAHVPVLPVTFDGGSKLWSRNMKPIVRGVTLSVTIHPPVDNPFGLGPVSDEQFAAFVHQLEATIATGLAT